MKSDPNSGAVTLLTANKTVCTGGIAEVEVWMEGSCDQRLFKIDPSFSWALEWIRYVEVPEDSDTFSQRGPHADSRKIHESW
jgi:hypothetical protein